MSDATSYINALAHLLIVALLVFVIRGRNGKGKQ